MSHFRVVGHFLGCRTFAEEQIIEIAEQLNDKGTLKKKSSSPDTIVVKINKGESLKYSQVNEHQHTHKKGKLVHEKRLTLPDHHDFSLYSRSYQSSHMQVQFKDTFLYNFRTLQKTTTGQSGEIVRLWGTQLQKIKPKHHSYT